MALTKLDPNIIGQDSTGAGKITSAGGSVSIDSSGNVRIANSSANTVTVLSNGNIGFGNTAPGYALDLGNKTDGMRLPTGNTESRPTGMAGVMRYNSTLGCPEFYNGITWVQLVDLNAFTQLNSTALAHSVVNSGGTGLQGNGSTVITNYGTAALSVTTSTIGSSFVSGNFSTHGGHSGSNSYPMYWGTYVGISKAVNQLKVWVHGNSWGYFELAGSNDCGNGSNFATNGTWTNIPFVSSTNSNSNQNMGGNVSGLSDGTIITFTYNNSTPYIAYRIKILDSSKPNQSLGTFYGGSAGYMWQLNRV